MTEDEDTHTYISKHREMSTRFRLFFFFTLEKHDQIKNKTYLLYTYDVPNRGSGGDYRHKDLIIKKLAILSGETVINI